MSLPMDAVDDLFAERFAEGLTPGLVYGVVRDGELVHHGALGATRPGQDERPTTESVFRIASMSKSFTAAAILLLRDRGRVDLDEAVAQYVPELVDLPPYSPGSPALSLRLLLSMSAGLLTDDPWADRQEALTYEEFGTFLDGGFTLGREPGIGFEYANLGYALLGRVVENVVGGVEPDGAFCDFVEHELIAPLGMTATRYDAAQVGAARVPGHVRRSAGWEELPATPTGAFSAIGGLHSSVVDLARWVRGFVDAFRPEADAHPLAKSSRREMQQLHTFTGVSGSLTARGEGAGIGAIATGYGFGLIAEHDAELGHFVYHSGGYPGYGSRMVWHPQTRLGVITASNATYAGAYDEALASTKLLVRAAARPTPGPRVPSTLIAVDEATDRVARFDPEQSPGVFADPDRFADNVELDVPDPERRTQLRSARESVGAPRPGPVARLWSRAMAHAGWTIPAERGRYDAELTLSPEETPRIQQLSLRAVPDAPEGFLARAGELLAGESPEARILRAFGEPDLVERPVLNDGRGGVELLVGAGPTWWKVTLTPGLASLAAHPTSAYPRLAQLARTLRGDS